MLSSFLIQTLNGLASASLLFLVALGLTLIFGVTRIVNFAHGSLYMLGAYLAASLFDRLGGGAFGFWGGALLAGLAVAAVGIVIEIAILRRIYDAPELLQLITTFGIVLVIKDAVLWRWGAEDLLGPRPPGFKGAFEIFGKPFPTYDLVLLAAGPAMLAAIWLLLTRTVWGMRVRAATEDRDMAQALGINQSLMFTSVFALGSFLAGLAGALALPRENATLGMDLSIIADVFVVTVVGGLGSIPGAYVAAILICVVKAWCIGIGDVSIFGTSYSFSKLTLVAEFIVMAVVLVVRPWGLFGSEPAPQRASATHVLALPQPDGRTWRIVAVGFAALALMPVAPFAASLGLFTDILVFALFAASLGLVMGWGGMASFGHAAYFGAGAYAAAIAAKAGASFPLALLSGVAFAGLLGVVFGWFCVRLSGVSLAMLTLAFAQITWAVAFQWDAVTGGSNGLRGVWPPEMLSGRPAYYLFALAVVGAALIVVWRLAHAPFGYALRATRDQRVRAAALGIDVARVQWAAIILAGALAGLAGAVYVFSLGSLSPDVLSIPRSMDALVMVLLGGVQSLMGPVFGAAVFTWLRDWILREVPYWQAVLGAVVILLTVAFPRGIAGTLRQVVERQRSRS